MSFIKTVKVRFQGKNETVFTYLADTDKDGREIVRVKSMINEYYLEEEIQFTNRDAAYDFIKHYPKVMAKAFLYREGYNSGALK